MNPLVSVIMPTKDRPDYVGRAVNSVLGQTVADFELIVLDNSSPGPQSELLAIAQQDPRIRFVEKKGTGHDERRRLGVQIARGKYVTFLDSDDYWSSDMLEQHLRAWSSCNVGLTWSRWALIENGRILEPRWIQPFPPNVVIQPNKVAKALYVDNFVPPCSALTSKEIIDSLGGWPTWSLISDWLMFIAIAEKYPALMVDRVLYYRDIDAPATLSKTVYTRVLKDEAKMRRHLLFGKPQIYAVPFVKMFLQFPITLAAGAKNLDLTYMKSRTLRLFG